jgi:FkbM family methyltransferase
VGMIFDVGANIGMTALEFADAFPAATVHAFEPGSDNMRSLNGNLSGKPDILRYQLAFGSEPGTADLLIEPEHPTMARIGAGVGPTEKVKVDTIDQFCVAHQISQIDLLKIDTEGYEIPVLVGAKGMLANNTISIIKAECAVDPDMNYHTQFSEVCDVLHPYQYRLFGLYDQWEDTLHPTPRIRRFDAAFISRALYADRPR